MGEDQGALLRGLLRPRLPVLCEGVAGWTGEGDVSWIADSVGGQVGVVRERVMQQRKVVDARDADGGQRRLDARQRLGAGRVRQRLPGRHRAQQRHRRPNAVPDQHVALAEAVLALQLRDRRQHVVHVLRPRRVAQLICRRGVGVLRRRGRARTQPVVDAGVSGHVGDDVLLVLAGLDQVLQMVLRRSRQDRQRRVEARCRHAVVAEISSVDKHDPELLVLGLR